MESEIFRENILGVIVTAKVWLPVISITNEIQLVIKYFTPKECVLVSKMSPLV